MSTEYNMYIVSWLLVLCKLHTDAKITMYYELLVRIQISYSEQCITYTSTGRLYLFSQSPHLNHYYYYLYSIIKRTYAHIFELINFYSYLEVMLKRVEIMLLTSKPFLWSFFDEVVWTPVNSSWNMLLSSITHTNTQ